MTDETLVERLKRLQARLLEIYAETVELRTDAETRAKDRRLNEWPETRHVSRQRDAIQSEPDDAN